jgi:hypothetical protein
MAPLPLSAFALLGFFKPARTFITNLINSFTNDKEGFSARKLSAFAGVSIAGYLSKEHSSEINVGMLVIYWLLFALLCLSIITFEQIIKLKNGKDAE